MVVVFGLLIGVSLGLLGSGGSILTVPALTYGLGHLDRVAIAESLLIVGAIALFASIAHVRASRVCWRTALLFGIPGMAGTYAGAVVAGQVSGTVQLLVFGIVMMAAAAFMFGAGRTPHAGRSGHSVSLLVLQGLAVGSLTGFVGVGGGFLIVPALIFVRRLPIQLAVGTSLVIIMFNSMAGFIKYRGILAAEELSINWMTIVVFILLGMLGTLLGARLHSRLDPRALRRVFALFLVVISIFIIFREGSVLRAPDGSARQAHAFLQESS